MNDVGTVEIRDFALYINWGQYWIRHMQDDQEVQYPVIMEPYNLLRLFEIEGIKPTKDCLDDSRRPMCFKKAVLERSELPVCGNLTGDEGDDLTPYWCWVKE